LTADYVVVARWPTYRNTGTLEAGERARFAARRLWIRLGAPWNLTATLNGKPVSLPGTTANVHITPRGVDVAQGGAAP
jgi:hypothetical protein